MQKPTKQACVGLLLIVVLFMSVMGQGDASSATDFQKVSDVMDALDEYQQFVAMLIQLHDPLVQAALAAYEALQAYAPEDQIRNAQVIINLLEGPQSPLYDATINLDSWPALGGRPFVDENTLPIPGIRPFVDAYVRESAERSVWAEEDPQYEDERGQTVELDPLVLQLFQDWLRLASASAVAATSEISTDAQRHDDLMTTQAFLVILTTSATELTRPLRVTVAPGESIQAAIDTAWAGATIFIDPGVYRETLYITKDLTLQGFGGDVVLEPINGQTGILIRSDDQIQVEISRLTIRDADIGLGVAGDVALMLDFVDLEGCATGISLKGNAHVITEDVSWAGNGITLLADESSDAHLINVTIEDSTSSLGAVVVQGSATVSLVNVTIMDGMGNGLLVRESATATVEESLLRGNALDGIRVADASHLVVTENDFYSNGGFGLRVLSDQCLQDGDPSSEAFSGLVSGSGNLFGSSNSVVANALGYYCPENLLFLIEPAPAEVSVEPGQSIQAAIDLVADGGVVAIEPGTYLEAVTIDKSLSLIGASDDSSGGVILNRKVDEPVISISSSVPIDVTLSDLVFQGDDAGWAIDVGENATARISESEFHDLGTVIRVHDGGSVTASYCTFTGNGSTVVAFPNGSFTASWCTFTDNRQAISASLGSICTLTDSTITGCTDDSAAISAWCSDLSLENCRISDNVGNGVRLGGGEASRLHMTDCQLTGNAYGLELVFGSCNPGTDPNWEAPTSLYDKSHGTVTGWGNSIPGADELGGNLLGSFEYYHRDLLDPTFLTEPKPEDE